MACRGKGQLRDQEGEEKAKKLLNSMRLVKSNSRALTLLSSLGNEGMKGKELKKAKIIERSNSIWEELFC